MGSNVGVFGLAFEVGDNPACNIMQSMSSSIAMIASDMSTCMEFFLLEFSSGDIRAMQGHGLYHVYASESSAKFSRFTERRSR